MSGPRLGPQVGPRLGRSSRPLEESCTTCTFLCAFRRKKTLNRHDVAEFLSNSQNSLDTLAARLLAFLPNEPRRHRVDARRDGSGSADDPRARFLLRRP